MGQNREHRSWPKLNKYSQLIFDKGTKQSSGERIVFSTNGAETTGQLMKKKKKKASRHCPYTFHKNKLKMDHRTECKTQNSKTPGSSLASSIPACEPQLFTVSLQPILLSALALCPIASSSWGPLLWPAHLCWQQIHGWKQGTWRDRRQTEHQNVVGQGSLISVTAMG